MNIICVKLQNIKGGGVARCWEEDPGGRFQSFLLLEGLAFGGRGNSPAFLWSTETPRNGRLLLNFVCYSRSALPCLSFIETLSASLSWVLTWIGPSLLFKSCITDQDDFTQRVSHDVIQACSFLYLSVLTPPFSCYKKASFPSVSPSWRESYNIDQSRLLLLQAIKPNLSPLKKEGLHAGGAPQGREGAGLHSGQLVSPKKVGPCSQP